MSVISHKHDSMSTRNMSTAERAVAKRCCCLAHLQVSPYLAGLSLCFSKHQDIVHPNGTLDVPCKNSASILAFENLDTYLYDFAGDPCPAHYLDDFGRHDLFFSCLAAHLSVPAQITSGSPLLPS